jgi:ATP-binding cassette subfamily B protein
LARYLKPYWFWAVLAPLLMLLEVTMDLMEPHMIQRIVDEGIAQYDMTIVIQTGLIMVGLALIGAIGGVGCTITSVLASQGFGTDLRGDLFRKVQSLSFGNLEELETEGIIIRLTNDIVQVQEMVAMLLCIMVRAPLMMVGSLILVINHDEIIERGTHDDLLAKKASITTCISASSKDRRLCIILKHLLQIDSFSPI